ncbi:hypothetical protein C9374_007096 [Naegleria lovaniensis]|uniref:Uncharacterized protein n=1 Tax=Naegleria lovaniensis TaxID=51637 RepID=A0AA88KXZ9_NAELO|nr:uncharacterized protein C9374_007096 [Naegleria lovaniensis]KAG2393565.1 hypothetical protein C9374_007096 [Naegleria lovaniensis]
MSSSSNSKFTIVDLTKEVEETTKEQQVSTNGRAKRNKINKRFRNNPGFASNFFFFPSNVNSTTGQSSHNLQSQQASSSSTPQPLNCAANPSTHTAATIGKHESEKTSSSRKGLTNTSPNSYHVNSSIAQLNTFTSKGVASDIKPNFPIDEKGNTITGASHLPSEIQNTILEEASMLDLLQNEDTCVEMSPSVTQTCLSTNNAVLSNYLSSPQNLGFSNVPQSNIGLATPSLTSNSSTTPPSSQKRHGRNPTAKRGSICQEILYDKRRYSCSDLVFSQTNQSSFTNAQMATINAPQGETPVSTHGRLSSPQATWEAMQSYVFPLTRTYEASEESSNERILCEDSQHSASFSFQEEDASICEAYLMNPSLKKRRPSVQVDTDSLSSFVANFQNQMNLSSVHNSSLGFNNVVLVNQPQLQPTNQVFEPSFNTTNFMQHQTVATNTTEATTIFNSLPETVQQQVVDIIVNHLLVQSNQESTNNVENNSHQQENYISELCASNPNAPSFLDEKDLQSLDLPGFDIATSEPSSDTQPSPSLLSPSTFLNVELNVNSNVAEIGQPSLASSTISSEAFGNDLKGAIGSIIQPSPSSIRDVSRNEFLIPSSEFSSAEITSESATSSTPHQLHQGVSRSNTEEVNISEEEFENFLDILFQHVPEL